MALYIDCQPVNYIAWNFITSIYLNLGLMSDYDQSYRKSTKFVIVIALWWVIETFWAGGFSENDFCIILNLVLYFLRVVGAYKIYTEFSVGIFPKLPLIWFDLVHWRLSFIEFRIGRRHIYINILMPGLYNYWWCITSLEYGLGKK